jgi:hypothetical protein
MKLIFKLTLLACIVGEYSCHSTAKKVKIDTTSGATYQQLSSPANADFSPPEDDIDTLKQPIRSKLIFPNFSIILDSIKFSGYRDYDNNDKFVYSGDTTIEKVNTKNHMRWTLTTAKDTAYLGTDDERRSLSNSKIELIPKSKADNFEISYCFKVRITTEYGKNNILWESMTPYKKIKDSLTYFYRLPSEQVYYDKELKDVKRKLKLKDTIFKKQAANQDYGIYDEAGVIFKNQLCEIENSEIIYLKIDRYNENKLIETKYLVVDFSIPE